MAAASARGVDEASFRIGGLSCASCVARVEKAIRAVPGVAAASVNLATERADVRFSGAPELLAVAEAIRRAGYRPEEEMVEIAVESMTCASCIGRVEKALKAVPGVLDAAANLATGRVAIRYAAGPADPGAFLKALGGAVERAGYQARRVATEDGAADADRRALETVALRRSLVIAALLTVPVVVLDMGGHLIPGFHDLLAGTIGAAGDRAIQAVLASAVLFGPGRRFFRAGIPALLRRAPDMNALVVLGTGAAWGFSVVATLWPGLLPAGTAQVYFEPAALIVTLILLGRFLEARARGRTSDAIRALQALAPKTARILRDGVPGDAPLAEVRVGDLVLVRPGETVPVDGLVEEGVSAVDEAMLSGEPVPVRKKAGNPVTGGTLNGTGSLSVRVTQTGPDTVLAQIVRIVEAAQGAKLPIQALVDRVTGWFVPAVIALAAATFLIWLALGPSLGLALVNAVAVLVVACPCAMGLATPTSIMVGTGRAAELGVLFRKGDALQVLAGADLVVFDKTGTLTAGRPALTDLLVADGFGRDAVLALAAAVESRSEHPVGRAVVDAALAAGLVLPEVTAAEAHPGRGIEGRASGLIVQIGSGGWMDRLGIDVAAFEGRAAALAAEAKTPFYVACDGRLAAVLAVADPVKPGARDAVAALGAQGLSVRMISGDDRRTAAAVARLVGIDAVAAEMSPAGKAEMIRSLRREGSRVAFVGDGLNDAPALAEADVGIALGSGSDVAIESAEIVLRSSDLLAVVRAVAVSRATMRNIRQNLFWAFAYNAVLIPVAAGLLYPVGGILLSPALAAGAMALSSVFVLGNALRLRRAVAPGPAASGI